MNGELLELVRKAQEGDKDALSDIIMKYYPWVRSARKQTTQQDRDDLEQYLLLTLTEVVLKYDLGSIPTFAIFKEQIEEAIK
jgi:DNA-directed RNA polymerase specialized sigma subunit